MEENSYAITRFASPATWRDPNTWTLDLLRSSSLLARSRVQCNGTVVPSLASEARVGQAEDWQNPGSTPLQTPQDENGMSSLSETQGEGQSISLLVQKVVSRGLVTHAMDEDGIGWMGGHRAELS